MPSASEELRSKMLARFGDRISEVGPENFLIEAGYKITRQWNLEAKPGVTCLNDMADDEWECWLFLVQEWDYGVPVSQTGETLK